MKITTPKSQSIGEIVERLLSNKSSQYTESAHAEIFGRLIATIEQFNDKSSKSERAMLILAVAQVILAVAQIYLAVK